jgi:hypothetical protein
MKKTTSLFVIVCLLICFNIANRVNAQIPSWIWSKSAGNMSYDYAQSVVTDTIGNSYVTGYFNISISFSGRTNFTSAGSTDMFVVKYSPSGEVLWAKSAGGTDADIATSVAVDKLGNVYVSGYFKSPTISFGPTSLTNAGGNTYDLFIVKYNSNGEVVWAKSSGGTGDDRAYGIAVDYLGNCFITGYFVSSTITFGSTTLTNSGALDVYLVKYNSNGTVQWAKSASGSGYDYAYGLAIDKFGNSFVVGDFNGNTITFGSSILTGVANVDMFVVKYAPDGNVLWANRAGVSSDNVAYTVAVDITGNCYVGGRKVQLSLLDLLL